MGKTLSEDLRVRVIAAVSGGASRRATAKRFEIAVATAVRWLRDWRASGSTKAKPKGGDMRSQRIEAFAAVILAMTEAEPDITLAEIAERLRCGHGASFAPSTVWRFFERHRISFKKNRARQRTSPARRGRGPRCLDGSAAVA